MRGRVAWVREVSPKSPLKSPGVGVEFIDLERKDVEFLQRLVDPLDDQRQPVDVLFEGMATPIRCQAAVVGQEVRLATRLPFMRLQSMVKINFVQQPEGGTQEGTLESIMLEPSDSQGVPHLRLSISTTVLDNARGIIEVKSTTPPNGTATLSRPPAIASTLVDPSVVTVPTPQLLTFGRPTRDRLEIRANPGTPDRARWRTCRGWSSARRDGRAGNC